MYKLKIAITFFNEMEQDVMECQAIVPILIQLEIYEQLRSKNRPFLSETSKKKSKKVGSDVVNNLSEKLETVYKIFKTLKTSLLVTRGLI